MCANASSSEAFYKALTFSKLTQTTYMPLSQYYYTSNFPNNAIVYLGVSRKIQYEAKTYTQNSKEGLLGIKISSIGLLAFLIGLIYMIYTAGRRVDKEGVKLISIDYVYLDVSLLIRLGL